MQSEIIPLLRCPATGAPLRLDGPEAPWVDEGLLVSDRGTRYPIRGGVAQLYVDDGRWAPKAREARGWVQLFRDTAGYIDDPDDYQMPYVGRPPWDEIAPQFDIALEIGAPGPGARVLDLGAGRGWAARRFAQRGCTTIAIDVGDDPLVGVGRALALAAHDGTRISPIVADGENLPLAPGCLDLVFCAATLHHATDLPALLSSVGRALRRGGLLIAINEPVIADGADSAAALGSPEVARELSYGINETRPHLDDYRRALSGAGLRERRIFPWQTHQISLESMRIWAGQLGVAGPDNLPTRRGLGGWLRRHGPDETLDAQRRAWGDHVFRTLGGTAVIVAERAG
jgi:SAM-dependent methyltransferase